ncbi:MAG: hypothetical protein QOF01_1949 [Thermomicrobiales bacterium]|jgi:hypothetical protein|nr:hypothetical protein [Thermomicrobiales bacterium]MEA2595480.1 hypothetical protein [Thermomicrobiales bacterium]
MVRVPLGALIDDCERREYPLLWYHLTTYR